MERRKQQVIHFRHKKLYLWVKYLALKLHTTC